LARCHAFADPAAREQEFPWLLACGFQVFIDGLTRLIRQLELDWLTGLLLPDRRTVDGVAIRGNVLYFRVTRSQPRSLLSTAKLNMAKSRVRPPISNRVLIDQTCFGRRGGFAPISFPLFQGARREVCERKLHCRAWSYSSVAEDDEHAPLTTEHRWWIGFQNFAVTGRRLARNVGNSRAHSTETDFSAVLRYRQKVTAKELWN